MRSDDDNLLSSLSDEHDLSTRAVEDRADAPLARPRETGPLDIGLAAPWVLDLHVDGVTTSFRLEVDQRLLIGRADGNINPDMNLTPFHGLEKGVSRRHAVIVATGDRLEIIDLKSTNGTFINGQRLQPFKPYRLRHGDELNTGEVRLDLTLDVMPVHLSPRWHQPWVRRRSVKSAAGYGRRVLIVEGNPETGSALKSILSVLNYDVQVVESLSDAFYAVTLRLPDAIILNLDLNVVNGLEICRYIQRLADDQHIPLIILSQHTDRSMVEEIMNAGADVFLGKPIGVDELVRAVATVTQDMSMSNDEVASFDDAPSVPGGDTTTFSG